MQNFNVIIKTLVDSNLKLIVLENITYLYRASGHSQKLHVPTRDIATLVDEKDLGLDSFKEEVDKNKAHFVALIEDIVQNMTKDKKELDKKYQDMVQKAEKDNKGK